MAISIVESKNLLYDYVETNKQALLNLQAQDPALRLYVIVFDGRFTPPDLLPPLTVAIPEQEVPGCVTVTFITRGLAGMAEHFVVPIAADSQEGAHGEGPFSR